RDCRSHIRDRQRGVVAAHDTGDAAADGTCFDADAAAAELTGGGAAHELSDDEPAGADHLTEAGFFAGVAESLCDAGCDSHSAAQRDAGASSRGRAGSALSR